MLLKVILAVLVGTCAVTWADTGASPPTRASSADTVVVSPTEAWRKIAGGALIVDVRTPEEFNSGHVASAANVPHTQIAQNLAIFGADKEREIILYCRSGRRSDLAAAELKALGYSRVYNAGGYSELAAAAAR